MAQVHRESESIQRANALRIQADEAARHADWRFLRYIKALFIGERCKHFIVDANNTVHFCGRHRYHGGLHVCGTEWENSNDPR